MHNTKGVFTDTLSNSQINAHHINFIKHKRRVVIASLPLLFLTQYM